MSEVCRLFGGEFVVKPDGIYTYAHYYEHPETKRRVIFVGMSHCGDREHFAAVREILGEAEIVLYESGLERATEEDQREAAECFQKFNGDNLDDAFPAALQVYFFGRPRIPQASE